MSNPYRIQQSDHVTLHFDVALYFLCEFAWLPLKSVKNQLLFLLKGQVSKELFLRLSNVAT